MNLEEKENTAEVAPEAAAQATIQAVQENNAQDTGILGIVFLYGLIRCLCSCLWRHLCRILFFF